MKTRTTPSSSSSSSSSTSSSLLSISSRMTRHLVSSLLPLSSILSLLLLIVAIASTPTTSATKIGVEQSSIAHLPYQYFHSDGVGGSNAACWLSRVPMPTIDNVTCVFAQSISQMKGRQIWQCEGDQSAFCQGCHALENQLSDPKELVAWKVQGC